jgi:hypothetical protein
VGEFLIAQMRFVIPAADGERSEAYPFGAKVAARERISCVYLTASPRDGARARLLLARFNVWVHCATGLEEAVLLLKTVGAKVLLVDHSFLEGNWPDSVRETSERCPATAVIVAVPVHLASEWENVIAAGGYEAVLKPFALEELGPVVRNAETYAREFLAAPECTAREKAVLDAIRNLSDVDPGCGGLKSERPLARKIAGLYRGTRAFVMKTLRLA